jgi:hypothetical protein
VTPNPGFLKFLGITAARAPQPWSIDPRIEIWQAVERRIRDLGGSAKGRSRLLYIRGHNETVEYPVQFLLRFHRPNLLIIDVEIVEDLDVPLGSIFGIRSLSAHSAVLAAVDNLIGMIKSGSIRDYSTENSLSFKPELLIPVAVSQDRFEHWRQENQNLIVGLAINNPSYDAADPDLAAKIFEQNREINIKFSRGAFSLVNKQGILTALSGSDLKFMKQIEKEHRRRCHFLELGLVCGEFLSNYLRYRQQDEDMADFLLYLGLPLYQKDVRFPKTVSGTFVWKTLSEDLGLPMLLEQVDKHFLNAVEDKTEFFQDLDEGHYHSLDFRERLSVEMRKYYRNWFERVYKRNPALVWIIGTSVAIGLGLLRLFLK